MTQAHVEHSSWSNYGDPLAYREPVPVSPANSLTEISRAAEELKIRSEAAIASMKRAIDLSVTEVEIGRLFVRAQAFIDQSVADAQLQASQILAEARATADGIVAQARQYAKGLTEEARQRPAMPLEAIQQLQRTIESFSRANSELKGELSQLHSTLTPRPATNGYAIPPQGFVPPIPSIPQNGTFREPIA
jgi:cell division septum initiation protein DivIVA